MLDGEQKETLIKTIHGRIVGTTPSVVNKAFTEYIESMRAEINRAFASGASFVEITTQIEIKDFKRSEF